MCFTYRIKILLNVIFAIHPVICLEHIAQIFHLSSFFFFFFFLPIMTRSHWRWWCALRPVFLYHCMWPPVWSPFQWQGGGLSCPRPYDQTRHVIPAHHRLLAVELASLVLIREAYCQQEISVSETEATSGKILGREARSLRVLVLSPVGQGQGRGSSYLLRVWTPWSSAQFWQEMNSSPSGTEETCPPEITHACKSINTSFFHFFPKFRMTLCRVNGVTHPAGLSSSLPVECVFIYLNFPFSLDVLYNKGFGNMQKHQN